MNMFEDQTARRLSYCSNFTSCESCVHEGICEWDLRNHICFYSVPGPEAGLEIHNPHQPYVATREFHCPSRLNYPAYDGQGSKSIDTAGFVIIVICGFILLAAIIGCCIRKGSRDHNSRNGGPVRPMQPQTIPKPDPVMAIPVNTVYPRLAPRPIGQRTMGQIQYQQQQSRYNVPSAPPTFEAGGGWEGAQRQEGSEGVYGN